MAFYSGSKPNLISKKLKNKVYKIIQNKPENKNTISEKIFSYISDIYNSYIKEHKILFFAIVIVAMFLIYRYCNRSGSSRETYISEPGYNSDLKSLSKLIKKQTDHLRYNTQPSFNRLTSVGDQIVDVNYPPDPIPMNIAGRLLPMKNPLQHPHKFPIMNTAKHTDTAYRYPSRSHYNGTYNTYQNAQDTDIQNPLGFSNNFNTTTGEFIKYMTDKNKQNIMNYQIGIDKENDDLKRGLRRDSINLNDHSVYQPYNTQTEPMRINLNLSKISMCRPYAL
uniref:Uncharacterized protein n=1 Tax=Mimivirus LCMiAC01 TaxID=2506608 RepID=A0A481Z0K1_9VIRU|nr:MAG: hypothetical protein LCMiAC01_02820 [Mimivirus LCMiAC01]